jgi:hypothetical protein
MRSRHHPNGGAVMHLNNARLEQLFSAYQLEANPAVLSEIMVLSEQRTLTLARFFKTARYSGGGEDEILSDVRFKLLRAVPRFDVNRGSAFTFLSAVITNVLRTSTAKARKDADRLVPFDDAISGKLAVEDESQSQELLEDVVVQLRRTVKTQLVDTSELEAQRWLVGSFCADGFESRRHTCANAAMNVFNLTHARARELYDLTMLGVRRVLFDLKPRRPIRPGQLFGRRCAWMSPYAKILDASEFTKFVVLMRDLAPYLLLLVLDPAHENNHRRDRNPTVGRRNLELILYGSAKAVPLFGRKSRG